MSARQDFLLQIKQARAELGNPEIVWYRGHQNSNFQLLPSLLRLDGGLTKEKELFIKWSQRSIGLLERRTSPWEILFDMQHYYVPTRLLDWSEVLGIAVYFATWGTPLSPCVWMLNPLTLNEGATGSRALKRCGVDQFDYQQLYWNKVPLIPLHPVAMEPPFQNPRIQAQKGMFTIHGDNDSPLEALYRKCVRKVEIPPEAVAEAREFLEFADINEFSMFPDLEGLAPFLTRITGLTRW
jgi:FRG domain